MPHFREGALPARKQAGSLFYISFRRVERLARISLMIGTALPVRLAQHVKWRKLPALYFVFPEFS